MHLVTANDPSLFEERLERTLAAIPDDATIVEIGFDTTADHGTVHFSALVRVEVTTSWG
jgi:hypothetical protein